MISVKTTRNLLKIKIEANVIGKKAIDITA